MVERRRSSREERVFFRLLLPPGYAPSDPGQIASVEWESPSRLVIRFSADLRPAQRDTRVHGVEVRYEVANERPGHSMGQSHSGGHGGGGSGGQ
jgi:hypothetical protein